MKTPQEVPVKAHTRTVWKPDPYAGKPDMFGEDPFRVPSAADAERGEQGKRRGKARAAGAHENELTFARSLAVTFAQGNPERTCTTADIIPTLLAKGVETGPWCGSIFSDGRWEDTGGRIKSPIAAHHSRELKVWRLKP